MIPAPHLRIPVAEILHFVDDRIAAAVVESSIVE